MGIKNPNSKDKLKKRKEKKNHLRFGAIKRESRSAFLVLPLTEPLNLLSKYL